MFHFGGFPSCTYGFSTGSISLRYRGCPIRRSTDIMLICSSPWLIAACHVLHRLLMPRHSPYALFRLNLLFGSLYCLSLANNCLVVYYFFYHLLVAKLQFFTNLQKDLCCFHSNFLTLKYIFTYFAQLSVRFFSYSVFNDHLRLLAWLSAHIGTAPTLQKSALRKTQSILFEDMGLSGLEPPTSR